MKSKKTKQYRWLNANKKVIAISASVLLLVVVAGTVAYQASATPSQLFSDIPFGKLSPAKQARLQHLQQRVEADKKSSGKAKPSFNTLMARIHKPSPLPTPEAGVFITHQGPFSPLTMTIRNAWQGSVNANWETLFAGGVADPSSGSSTPVSGAVRLYIDTNHAPTTLVGMFTAPNNIGPLTITSVEGSNVNLKSDSGQVVTFNLQTHKFN